MVIINIRMSKPACHCQIRLKYYGKTENKSFVYQNKNVYFLKEYMDKKNPNRDRRTWREDVKKVKQILGNIGKST